MIEWNSVKVTKSFTTVIAAKRHALLKTAFMTFHSIILSTTSIFVILNFVNTKCVTHYQKDVKSHFG
jgi:hypothetical protein